KSKRGVVVLPRFWSAPSSTPVDTVTGIRGRVDAFFWPPPGPETGSDVLVEEDRVAVRVLDDEEAGTRASLIDLGLDREAGVLEAPLELADIGERIDRLSVAVPPRVERERV